MAGSVKWSPAVIHPGMSAGDSLVSETVTPPGPTILGAGNRPLVTEQPVVNVGVEPSRVKNLPQLTAQLASLLQIDPEALTTRVKASSPNAFVDVITLRRPTTSACKAQLQPLPGHRLSDRHQLPLAPTHDFARALLGTVGSGHRRSVKAASRPLSGGPEGRTVRPAGAVRPAAWRDRRV